MALMRSGFSSRRRFIYRLIVYSLAPWVGLYVLLANPNLQGRLLGLMCIAAGGLALYMLFSRLKDPLGTICYAFRPVSRVSQILERWHPGTSDLRALLMEALPDIEIKERLAAGERIALAVGEELLVHLSSPLERPEDLKALKEAAGSWRTPLHEEPLLIVLPGPSGLTTPLKELEEDLSPVRFIFKRS